MRILIITPAPLGSKLGNAVTAQRYAGFFRFAKWNVRVAREYTGQNADLLVALHARKSADAARAFRRDHPMRPIVVVLTGTDVYRDLPSSMKARRALAAANAIVTLQPLALRRLDARTRRKALSIVQSSPLARALHQRTRGSGPLRICILGHLRTEKDPLRAAYAVRKLPKSVDVCITQAGAALDPRFAVAARREMQRNRRYRWVGELSQAQARCLLRSSDIMVLSSLMEGGANVLCEAIACGVPVLASRIDGNVGILGARYPGFYRVRDTLALARLMRRVFEDPAYVPRLRRWVLKLRSLVAPLRERDQWVTLVRVLVAAAALGSTEPRR